MRILLIEDDKEAAAYLARALREAGHVVAVDPAEHAPRAVAHARLARFDGAPPAPLYLREPDAAPREAA